MINVYKKLCDLLVFLTLFVSLLLLCVLCVYCEYCVYYLLHKNDALLVVEKTQ